MTIVRVGLDVPLGRTFDYLCPNAVPADIGQRVLVPFGRRTLIGVVLEVSDHSQLAPEKLKRAVRILHGTPALTDADLRLLRFGADYYHYPLGQVVLNALPARLRSEEQPKLAETE